MWALVESGSISKIFTRPTQLTIGDIKYPRNIFEIWSESELKRIGIYTIEIDSTNKKDEEWYNNTNITYAFGSGKVTGTYGTATAKAIADADAVDTDGNKVKDENGKQIIIEGLKTKKKRMIDNQCAELLAPSDWRVVKATETGDTMDSGWKTWRASVRTKCNSMQTQIDNASDVDALAALFTYTEKDGVVSRPLGEFPEKE